MRNLDAPIDLKLPKIKKREIPFERSLRDELKRRGVGFVKLKPTINGFPDRLAIGHGHTKLVEIKREGEEARENQRVRHADLWRRYRVRVMLVAGPDVRAAANDVEHALRRRS